MKKLTVFVLALALVVLVASAAMAFPAKEVYRKSSPAVVLIVASSGSSGSLVGAGSIITRDGMVITNAHVVVNDSTRRPYKKISVYTRPEEITGDLQRDLKYRHNARVLAFDRDLDLALVKVEALRSGTGTIKLADPKEIMVGEEVVAIGHPEQGGLWTLTYGRISTHIANQGNVKGKNVYQTDTSVNRGNSGGPLLDGRGYLVGVNTNIARTGSGGLTITGVNFALKSSVVTAWLRRAKGLNIAYGKGSASSADAVATAKKPVAPAAEPVREQPVAPRSEPALVKKSEPKAEKPVVKKPTVKKPVMSEKPLKSDTILTPKRPYSREELYEQVEKEMMDMMDEMKRDFQKKKRKLR